MAGHERGIEIELTISFKKSSEPGTKKYSVVNTVIECTVYILLRTAQKM